MPPQNQQQADTLLAQQQAFHAEHKQATDSVIVFVLRGSAAPAADMLHQLMNPFADDDFMSGTADLYAASALDTAVPTTTAPAVRTSAVLCLVRLLTPHAGRDTHRELVVAACALVPRAHLTR